MIVKLNLGGVLVKLSRHGYLFTCAVASFLILNLESSLKHVDLPPTKEIKKINLYLHTLSVNIFEKNITVFWHTNS